MTYGLGRRVAVDDRDQNFLLAAPRVPAARTYRSWYANGWWGDQGQTPMCVGYAWAHWIEDSPVTHPDPHKTAYVDPTAIYYEAQRIDEWDGENYEGTSVRAGAKWLQSQGHIGEYLWAFDIDTVARNVLEVAAVVMGTNWYDEMFTPDAKHVLHPYGYLVGGHAYVVNGYNRTKKLFRVKNSWGRAWGKDGHAWISFDDLGRLLSENGEACMAVEP